ncbi:MAG: hypothetical protein ACMUJM_02845 [bacterium]
MSGEKCAHARLTREAKRELQKALEESRCVPEAKALIAKVKEESRLFRKDFSLQAEQYMKKEYKSFVNNEKDFEAAVKVFFELVERNNHNRNQLEKQNLPVQKMQEAARQIKDDYKKVREAEDGLTRRVKKLCSAMDQIRGNIDKSIIASEKREFIQRELRAKIAVLVKEFEERLASDTALYWVRNEIEIVLLEGKRLQEMSSRITHNDVEEFSRNLEHLSRQAQERELEYHMQWEIANRLCTSFEECGFQVVKYPSHTDTGSDSDIDFIHQARGEFSAQVQSSVSPDQHINFIMEGASGEESIQLGVDENCDERLKELILRLKEKGVIIENISWKGPGGIWRRIYNDISYLNKKEMDEEIQNLQEQEIQM